MATTNAISQGLTLGRHGSVVTGGAVPVPPELSACESIEVAAPSCAERLFDATDPKFDAVNRLVDAVILTEVVWNQRITGESSKASVTGDGGTLVAINGLIQ